MKTEVYTCDLCKCSKSPSDLSSISVTTRGITIRQNHFHPPVSIDICKDCLKAKGFVVNPVPTKDIERVGKQNENTLRDKLLDILEDLDVSFHE